MMRKTALDRDIKSYAELLRYYEKMAPGTIIARETKRIFRWLKELKQRREADPVPMELDEGLLDDKILFADGFEGALIGWAYRFKDGPLALYDREKCLKILIKRDGMAPEDAEEFFEFNTLNAWVGPRTPVFAKLERLSDKSSRHHSKRSTVKVKKNV